MGNASRMLIGNDVHRLDQSWFLWRRLLVGGLELNQMFIFHQVVRFHFLQSRPTRNVNAQEC